MASAASDPSIDPIFQLQQPGFEVGPLYPPVPSDSPPVVDHGAHDGQVHHDDAGANGASVAGVVETEAGSSGTPGAPEELIAPSDRPIIPPGVDTSTADLTYRRSRRDFSVNNPSPDGWLYPHKKGIGTGSNLEAFKGEIEARTQKGENCKAIADALNAMGVQTSDRAVSRVRIKWGMRKRAQRKQKTPPPESEAARLSAKSKVQALRKIEITRMTKEGMTAEEIYDNLTSRGMELKKGVATVLRLQSAWKLIRNEKRWVENFRHQCHKQAKAQQIQAFKDISNEIAVDDLDAWLQAKMNEDVARKARHELALTLMGEHAPSNPERRKLQKSRAKGSAAKQQRQGDDMPGSDSEAGNGYETEFNGGDGEDDYTALPDQTDIDMDDDDDISAPEPSQMYPEAGLLSNSESAVPNPDQNEPQPTTSATFQPTGSPGSQTAASKRVTDRSSKKAVAKPIPIPDSTLPLTPGLPNHRQSLGAPPNLTSSGAGNTPSISQDDATEPSTTPGPSLVLRPEEAEANKSALSTLDQYNAAAQAYKEILQARTDNKPMAGSLTGLPPSAKQVDVAKRKLKELTQAMMLSLD